MNRDETHDLPADDPPTFTLPQSALDAARLAGLAVPGYELLGEVGRGGMGVVYQARHTALGRTVALKVVVGASAGDKTLIRFLAEAEAVAAVRHPHVVQVYEYGEADGRPFMALEFCPGGSLADRLRGGNRLDPHAAAELLQKIATGVAAAHAQGIVHRDLKPGNVLFDAHGQPRVADFGIAKRAARELTATQAVMGTPAYMSPEQAGGKAKFVGPAADVWALGVILYECLTGKRPFDGDAVDSVLGRVLLDDPTPPRQLNPKLPRDLEAVCLRCLEKDPARRYATAAELAEELSRFLAGEPISAVRYGVVGRFADSLDRVPLDRRLAGYATLLLALAPVMLLTEVWIAVVIHHGWPRGLIVAANAARAVAFLAAVGYRRGWRLAPDGPAERQLWAVWGGYLVACYGAGTSAFLATGLPDVGRYTEYYPALANLTALAFFALAPTLWGYAALVGAGFFGLSFVMAADLRWAPLLFGAAWAGVLSVIGLRLRRLGRMAAGL